VVLGYFCRQNKGNALYLFQKCPVTITLRVLDMKTACVVIFLGGTLAAQSLVEYSGAAAGGAAGGVAGKKVSDGMTSIFNKLDKATAKAAGEKAPEKATAKDKNAPVFDVGPGVPHSHGTVSAAPPSTVAAAPAKSAREEPGSVPPPPPVHRSAVVRKPTPRPVAEPVPPPIPPPPPPPPPVATAADLKTIAVGTGREDVLKLGVPAARITMYDDGHLVEIFRYMSLDTNLGIVRLSDGTVSNVQVH
jgi:hypothetical protein